MSSEAPNERARAILAALQQETDEVLEGTSLSAEARHELIGALARGRRANPQGPRLSPEELARDTAAKREIYDHVAEYLLRFRTSEEQEAFETLWPALDRLRPWKLADYTDEVDQVAQQVLAATSARTLLPIIATSSWAVLQRLRSGP